MTFSYNNKIYPEYIRNGNAINYIETIAKSYCKGKGLDIGGFYEWTLKGSIPVNILDDSNEYDAYNIPHTIGGWNYIFSSHTLEHLENPVKAINIWKTKLSDNGLIFLYLPHPDMEYWLPQNNKKHLHSWYPKQMIKIFKDLNFKNIIFSERDLYWSYSVIGWT